MICATSDHASSTRKPQITVVMIGHCVSTKKLANEFAISVTLRSMVAVVEEGAEEKRPEENNPHWRKEEEGWQLMGFVQMPLHFKVLNAMKKHHPSINRCTRSKKGKLDEERRREDGGRRKKKRKERVERKDCQVNTNWVLSDELGLRPITACRLLALGWL